MTDHLPRDILAALEAARRQRARKAARLSVTTGALSYPVLRLLPDGFALDAAQVTQLRGLVEIAEGERTVARCLIVASAVEGGELICRMKWSTAARSSPPLDYVRDEGAPVGYLPRPAF